MSDVNPTDRRSQLRSRRSQRSQRYGPPAINTGVRAVRANLRVTKTDRHGRVYQGRDQHLLGQGFHDSREAERLLLDAAEELGLEHDAIELEARHWLKTEINAGFGPG